MRRVQIAFRKRAEDPQKIVQRLGHVFAKRVERFSDIEHEPGLAGEIDALREVADDRSLHKAADRASNSVAMFCAAACRSASTLRACSAFSSASRCVFRP